MIFASLVFGTSVFLDVNVFVYKQQSHTCHNMHRRGTGKRYGQPARNVRVWIRRFRPTQRATE